MGAISRPGPGTSVMIWDAETSAIVGKPVERCTGWVTSIAYSPDGWHIVSASDEGRIRIWDAGTGAAVGRPLEGHSGLVKLVAYSPDGRHIISGSDDRTIRIWDADTGVGASNPMEGYTGWILSEICGYVGDRAPIVQACKACTGPIAAPRLRGSDVT